MKHQEYNGYPAEFNYLCHKGKSDIWPRAYVAQRQQVKELGKFFAEIESHGYDIYKPSDGFLFDEALRELNEASRRDAIKNGFSSYERVKDIDEICRCGKWVFLRQYPNSFSQIEKTDIEKGRGGKREGSGRKSNSQKLFISKTTTVRVPWNFKDNIKELCDFFIKKSTEGVDIKQVLSNASWQLHQKAEDYRTADYTSETTEGWARDCEQAEKLLLELGRMIPYIHLKEDEESNSK